MLAKIWKKLLLVICVIAILFNITIKLVNRISLEKAISSTPDGVNLREILNITEEQRTTTTNYNDSVSKYKTVEEVEAEKAAEEAEKARIEAEEQQEKLQNEVSDSQNDLNNNEEIKVEENTGGKIIDKVTQSIKDTKKYDNILN